MRLELTVGYIGGRMAAGIEAAFIDEYSDALRSYWNDLRINSSSVRLITNGRLGPPPKIP